MDRHGEKNPNHKPPKFKTCDYCGKEFRLKHTKAKTVFCSMKCMGLARVGPNNKQWIGGSDRRSPYAVKYRDWRKAVFERDGSKCIVCSATEQLEGHHIKSWALHPDLRFVVSNGQTLCKSCHYAAHGKRLKGKSGIVKE